MTASMDDGGLPRWMRRALLVSGVLNVTVAAAFTPPAGAVRALLGFPRGDHALYLATIALFVLLFGLGYLWTGITGRAERLFIALSAAGKLAFFALVAGFWAAGDLPPVAPLAGSADLVLGCVFLLWLVGTRPDAGAGRLR